MSTATKKSETAMVLPGFKKTPYGGRLQLVVSSAKRESVALIVLAPHKNTAAGIESGKLNKNGLRSHEGIEYEEIHVLGFADDDVANGIGDPIVHRFQRKGGQVMENHIGIRHTFTTVNNNGAYGDWHVIENDSDRPVMLLVITQPKPLSEVVVETGLNLRLQGNNRFN